MTCPELGLLGGTGSSSSTLQTHRPGCQLDVRPAGSCEDSPAPRWPDAERTLVVVVVAVLLSQLLAGGCSVFPVDLCGCPAPALDLCDLSLEKPLPGRLGLLGRSRPGLSGRRAGTDGLHGGLQRSQQHGGRAPRGFRPAGAARASGGDSGGGTCAAVLGAEEGAGVLPWPVASGGKHGGAFPAPGRGLLKPE